MQQLKVEKTASMGIVVAPVFKYEEVDLNPSVYIVAKADIDSEIEKFNDVKAAVLTELEELAKKNDIFSAHTEIAGDYTLVEGVISKIRSQNKNVEQAVHETIDEVATMFSMVDDAYMKERSADIRDVGKRYMSKLKNIILPDLGSIDEEVIVVARDLYPSDTVKIDTKFVKGILTEEGGVTSHVYIIAKSMDIPILVGIKGLMSKVESGETVCMDAKIGDVILQADDATKEEYIAKREEFLENKKRLTALRSEKVVTKDGKEIHLCINAGNVGDVRNALPLNNNGVGLFRSELLYMENSHFPTEEEQFAAYSEAAKICTGELTIRTLDIGGDKELSYFEFEKEENPFLGWRAVRICLEMKDMFKEQIRAILRASAFGHVRMMVPMIISVEEYMSVKTIVEECKTELRDKGIAFDEKMEVGIMIETPSCVLLADEFAKVVDFFSIGTNDLTQYLLAVDRGNKKIADKYSYFHPAVVKAIGQVIDAGHRAGIKVGMCGEMAGDIKASKMLLDMGLDEFSMSASSLDYVREALLNEVKK